MPVFYIVVTSHSLLPGPCFKPVSGISISHLYKLVNSFYFQYIRFLHSYPSPLLPQLFLIPLSPSTSLPYSLPPFPHFPLPQYLPPSLSLSLSLSLYLYLSLISLSPSISCSPLSLSLLLTLSLSLRLVGRIDHSAHSTMCSGCEKRERERKRGRER